MNAETQAILLALKTQGEALTTIMNQISVSRSNTQTSTRNLTDTLLTHSITFEAFNEEAETFASYRERLENFFTLRQISGTSAEVAKAKVQILINCLGSKYYQLISSLTSPSKPSDKTYTELIELLEKQLSPPSNVHTERHKFLSRIQHSDESIASYVAALKLLLHTCKWVCPIDNCKQPIPSILQAQFIRGLKDVDIREKILQQDETISFDKTLEIALAIEAAKRQNKEDYQKPAIPINRIGNTRRSNKAEFYNNKQQRNRSKSRQRPQIIDRSSQIERLGLKHTCLSCGCKKPGHLVKVCMSTALGNKQLNQSFNSSTSTVNIVEHNPEDEYAINSLNIIPSKTQIILDINSANLDQKIIVSVGIGHNKQSFSFELDSGSPVTIISRKDFDSLSLDVKLKPTNIKFRSYTKELFSPQGVAIVPVSYNNKKSLEELYVVERDYSPILGRVWIRRLGIINLNKIENNRNVRNIIPRVLAIDTPETFSKDILSRYSNVFEARIGRIPNVVCSLKIQENAKPIYIKPRPIPYALIDQVNDELDSLEKQGIIEKSNYCQWGSPLVVVPKPGNQGVRICADYKISINPLLLDNRYPIPRVEDLFNKLRGGNYFCVLDIHKAYLHVELDKESSHIAAISTHKGTYLAKRMFYGLKTAPAEFHKILDPILSNLEGTLAYFDDILIQGETLSICKQRVEKCLKRLQDFNIQLNYNKCKFFVREIKYLGHVISTKGLLKTKDKILAVQKAPIPTNVEELRFFLGLAMYYQRFIPNASTLFYPLNQLLRHDTKYQWSRECNDAFEKIKTELASERVLTPYNPNYPLILETDASPVGLSGILSHEIDNEIRPIAYASRSLTVAEKNYSQLDREATAVFWACKHFFQYIYGRHFTLVVDNNPLKMILEPNKQLPQLTALRLLRYALFLRGFEYSIKHRPASSHQNADYFSRAPLPCTDVLRIDEISKVFDLTIHQLSTSKAITAETIRQEINKDSELLKIKERLQNGKIRDPELSLHKGLVMRGQRVYIPSKLQPEILKELHATHVGIVKMKAIARSVCYWPNIDRDIESLVKSCIPCALVKKMPNKAPLHHWEVPKEPWQRIHVDYAGPFHNRYFLIVVDAKTKWVEIQIQQNAPTSKSTIADLAEIFSRQGLPYHMVTDNASIFKSEEFTSFCNRNGIKLFNSAPNYPRTNGAAERQVQTFKNKIKCMMMEDPGNINEKLQQFLFRYRNTPLENKKTPSELHMGRPLRTKLDLIKPSPNIPSILPNFEKFYRVGERVQSRNYYGNVNWKFGTIIQRLGRLHYLVRLDDGYELKRHYDQLCSTEVGPQTKFNLTETKPQEACAASAKPKPKRVVTFQLPTQNNLPCLTTTPPSLEIPVPAEPATTNVPMEPVRRSTRPRKPLKRMDL
ncbi:uncharacterized protein K02A2.6-like [Chrysoperla carnea]|uniref:uncharacterized protein K02A2.6-like n=1 Tax=Chrysoperla carnea TaxID=189513 RepID=UPI001D09233B|nr:uncharacterized protein K02A2.6-like [Chrysoperla carnea]